MTHRTGNIIARLSTLALVIIALLALTLPAEAVVRDRRPTPTPTIEINPDAQHHPDGAQDEEGPAPMSLLEMASSACVGRFCRRISVPGHRLHEPGSAQFIYRAVP